jgi:ParB/RepB/Spo0J family partition protein
VIAREHRSIPVELIDEPDAPTRLSIDPEKFEQLVISIRERGQLQPGGVVPNGERFTISYGHRRLLAVRALELPTYDAYVYDSDSVAMLGAQLDENVIRHDLNPVEEAYWFTQLFDAKVGDTDELALQLGKTREYVESRMLLLKGDPHVLDALQKGRIGLGVAKLLNAYDDDGDRLVLLTAAVDGGASARLVSSWLADRRAMRAALHGQPAIDPTVAPSDPTFEGPKPLTCLYCDGDQEVYLMIPLWIHKPCFNMLRKILERHLGVFDGKQNEVGAGARGPRSTGS